MWNLFVNVKIVLYVPHNELLGYFEKYMPLQIAEQVETTLNMEYSWPGRLWHDGNVQELGEPSKAHWSQHCFVPQQKEFSASSLPWWPGFCLSYFSYNCHSPDSPHSCFWLFNSNTQSFFSLRNYLCTALTLYVFSASSPATNKATIFISQADNQEREYV